MVGAELSRTDISQLWTKFCKAVALQEQSLTPLQYKKKKQMKIISASLIYLHFTSI